mmetsp:Transcript_18752/g.51690  ORF Transcript_18752/g.51690 Transcript_18752/m.51690 type:complete len:145 (-) Transcript_18752:230-664(-)
MADKSEEPVNVGDKRQSDAAESKEPAKRNKGDEDSDGDDEKSSGKFQKRMMALQFGYIGTGYAGLQKNPGQKTIEDELEKALFQAGAISAHNHGDLKKVLSSLFLQQYNLCYVAIVTGEVVSGGPHRQRCSCRWQSRCCQTSAS